jgi:hypothetical protein
MSVLALHVGSGEERKCFEEKTLCCEDFFLLKQIPGEVIQVEIIRVLPKRGFVGSWEKTEVTALSRFCFGLREERGKEKETHCPHFLRLYLESQGEQLEM